MERFKSHEKASIHRIAITSISQRKSINVRNVRNEYFRLKTKIEETKQTLLYLKKCKRWKIYPKFIKVDVVVWNSISKRVTDEAKKMWLNLEIDLHHSNLVYWERKTYELYLRILVECSSDPLFELWMDNDRLIREVVEHKRTKKRITQNRKFDNMKPKHRIVHRRHETKNAPVLLDNFVINLSSTVLSDDEMSLLNRFLKFVLPPVKPPNEDLCIDIMASVRYKPIEIKNDVELSAKKVIREIMKNGTSNNNREAQKLNKIAKSLREKKTFVC